MSLYSDFKDFLFVYDRKSVPTYSIKDLEQLERIKYALFFANPLIANTKAVNEYCKALDKKHQIILAECIASLYGVKHLLNFVDYDASQFVLKRFLFRDFYYASVPKLAPSSLAKSILKNRQAVSLLSKSFGFDELTFSEGLQQFVLNHPCDDFEKEKPQLDSALVWSQYLKYFEPYRPKSLNNSLLEYMSFTRHSVYVNIFFDRRQSYIKEDTRQYTLTMQKDSTLIFMQFLLEYTTLEAFISLVNSTVSKFANQSAMEKFRQQFLVE